MIIELSTWVIKCRPGTFAEAEERGYARGVLARAKAEADGRAVAARKGWAARQAASAPAWDAATATGLKPDWTMEQVAADRAECGCSPIGGTP